ncbi:hypothetical protein OCT51_11155 [Halomonas sp. LR3S48]|uniref:hypothetical protein n=1 Tax=Halomonas sp. LR3S48 TaxID=2982694 RepID=UPI0021E3D50A|nr:hypothetical protein [Halomonas sp. LR3S48]UYG01771.1 hypothetical protein OCT51_11155 [Halomonas sp. LR3S48]
MKADLLKRLETLEACLPRHGDSNPHRLYQELAAAGLETPEPLVGESMTTWLTRVPTATLEVLVEMRDAHA